MKLDPDSVVALVSLIAGCLGVPLVQVIKEATGWQDKQALLLTMGVCVAISAVISVVNGLFSGVFDPQQWVTSLGVVLSTAMVMYRAFIKKPQPLPEE